MDIQAMLNQSGAIPAMAQELGIDAATASSGAQALLPAILGGFGKQGDSGGLDALGGLIGSLGGGGLLDAVTGAQPTPVGQGNEILGQIFGSKDTSRAVADHASAQTGISPDLLKKMLPILAMVVAGYFARQGGTEGGGGLGGILGSVLGGAMGGGQPQPAPQQGGGLGDILGSVLGGGAGGGGVNPLDAILGQLRR